MTAPLMTNFDEVYALPDPRGYFTRLRPLAYRTPQHAQHVFRELLGELGPGPHTVLDLCCSYGINATLLNHYLTLDQLYARYSSPELARLSTAELMARDRAFYSTRRRRDTVRTIGLDSSRPAVTYAHAAGLLDEGHCADLETAEPGEALLRAAAEADLITVTGGSSFLTERTYGPLVAANRGRAPVASFVLRQHDYRPVAACLADAGLEDWRSPVSYPQRRFTDTGEQRRVINAVVARGEDPTGKEAAGWHHAWLHVARPAGPAGRAGRPR
ncbi:hypothetical protein [Streptomyces sp. NPDC089799]|uniref:hypothetical protein n=1 Tax=Streptomyces sp. NPDC089799 TaxID=3155066 RepID=UPI0034330413